MTVEQAKKSVLFAARRLGRRDWPDTSHAGMLRRLGFHDVADAIAHLQTACLKLDEAERRVR